MKNVIIILSFLCLGKFSAEAQSYEQLILGKWSGTFKETRAGNRKLNNGKLNKELGIYEFRANGSAIDHTLLTSPQKTVQN